MTTNVHFSKGTVSEQYLYEDLIIEAIQIYGHDVFYLPRKLVNEDTLMGEDPLSQFDDAYGIEMWMTTQEGYDGERDLVTRFGLEIRNETSFVVSRRRWDDVVSDAANLIGSTRPTEGDLIYFPTIKRMWEISFVDHDDPFYQVNNLPVYRLYCRSFEYSSERLDTGIEAIDSIEDKRSLDELMFQLSGEIASGVIYNERIGQEWGTIYAEDPASTPWPPAAVDILLEDDSYLLAEDNTGFASVLLESSDVAYGYSFFVIGEAFDMSVQAPQSDNEFLDTEALTILDFTETNPFGEPS